jgi:hypothetical protein
MTTDRALYEKMYAAQLAEGHDLETAMRYNKAATPEDFLRAFGESSDPRHQHRKWGGGNKMGSGGAAVNAARKARAAANAASRGPGLGFHLGQMARGIKARFNDTQGKNMPSNPSFVGVGANPSYGNDVSSFDSFSPSSFLGNMSMGSLIAGDPNRGLNRGRDYGVGDSKEGSYGYTTDSDFGRRMREAVLGMPIQASVPRMAGLFIT